MSKWKPRTRFFAPEGTPAKASRASTANLYRHDRRGHSEISGKAGLSAEQGRMSSSPRCSGATGPRRASSTQRNYKAE